MLDFAPGASDTPQATKTQTRRHHPQMGGNSRDVSRLRNEELLGALKRVVLDVRERTADGIALLAEVAARDLHVKAGYSSLFTYCLGEFHFSRAMAWRWSKTARAAAAAEATAAATAEGHSFSRDDVVERLRAGRLSLCTAATLADHPDLLAQADFLTREEAVALLAAVKPKLDKRVRRRDILPAVPAAVVVVTEKTLSQQQQDAPGLVAAGLRGAMPEEEEALLPPPSGTASPSVLVQEATFSPPAPERLAAAADEPSSSLWERLHLDVSGETLRKLHRARALLPGKSLDDILECALDLLLDGKDPLRRHDRRQQRRAKATAAAAAATTTTTTTAAKVRTRAPGESPAAAAREDATTAAVVIEGEVAAAADRRLPLRPHLSRVMHDAVTARAGGRCEYVARGGAGDGEGEKEGGAGGHHRGGRRCTEHAGCEIDHICPLALGGDNSLSNLRLLCRSHHRLVTEESFPGWAPRRRRPPAETR